MRWLPLESNPETLNNYSRALGLKTDQLAFCDVFGLDEDLLGMVPAPAKAVLLLFPITKFSEEVSETVDESSVASPGSFSNLVFIKQRICNACGTIALLHAFANIPDPPLHDGPFKQLLARCCGKTPEECAEIVESSDLGVYHEAAARGGQSRVPSASDSVDLHFVVFIDHKGELIELDGRRPRPVSHGPVNSDLLRGVVPHLQKLIGLSSGSLNFNLMALAPPAGF